MEKMTRIVLALVLVSLWMAPADAQKKEIENARTIIKSGKDFDKAEKLMTDLLAKDADNRDNPKIYLTWFDAVKGQFSQANEKLYLKQKYDTAAFFNLTKRLYDIAETLDSIDARPDKKGRVRPSYRKDHAAELDQLRANLYFGGTYHIRKNEYAEAFAFMAHYLDTDVQPLFTGYQYAANDGRMPQAAYWATFCGYRLQDADMTLRYSQLARKDTAKLQFTLQYLAEAYHRTSQEQLYVETLREGFRAFPEYPYFFPRLADYYTAKGRNDSVLVIADYGLAVNGNNALYQLAKSIALLNLERYDECIAISREMIAKNDTLPEPYFNMATCYLNQALELEQKNEPRLYRQQLQKLYADARPYMETYRRLMPDDSQRWAPALYRIYLNLNMGRQFDEIDRLLK